MDQVLGFLRSEINSVIVVGACILVLVIILGKLSRGIIGRLIRGLFVGAAIAAVLHFVAHLKLELVAIIGLASFILTAIFGRIGK